VSGLSFSLLALIALLAVSGFFSGAEAALFSLERNRVRELGASSANGRIVASLLERPRRVLVTILLGNLVVNVFATSAATALCIGTFGRRGLGIAFVGMSALLLAFGEVIPKTVALRWRERVSLWVVLPLRVIHTLVLPVRVPLAAFADGAVLVLRRMIGAHSRSFTHEEIVTALRIARDEGNVGNFEYEMLVGALRFRHTVVREIMTPSINVISAPLTATRTELLEEFGHSGKSRLPIYGESPDHIVGVLHVKDLIAREAGRNEADLRARLREPFFVQETEPISSLYNALQMRNAHFAIVLDEYSSFAGGGNHRRYPRRTGG